jgi:hypothetical protein
VVKVNIVVKFTVEVPDGTDLNTVYTQADHVEFMDHTGDPVASVNLMDGDYETVSVEEVKGGA